MVMGETLAVTASLCRKDMEGGKYGHAVFHER